MAAASAFNVSVVFRADTSAAKAGVAEFRQVLGSIGAATGSSASAANQNAAALTDNASAARRAAAAQTEYATAAKRAAAEVLSANAAASSLPSFPVVQASLPSNLSGLATADASAQSSALAIANTRLGDSYRQVGQDVVATVRETALYRQEMDAIRAQYNPLFAASQRYEQQLRDIGAAERQGAISALEAAAARDRAAAAMAPMANGIAQVGVSSGAAAAYTQNLTFQLNDIAMMMAAGQNPFMLMMQQGPQVTQVFDSMKASGMSIGTALRTALLGMISPANIATMAVIGLGAALVQYLSAGVEKSKTLSEAIDDLKGSTTDLGAAMAEAKTSIWELRQEFGDGATAAREMNLALLDLARLESLDKLTTAAEGLKATFGGLVDQVDLYNQASLNASGALRADWLEMAQTAIRQIQSEFGLSIIQATQLAEGLRALDDTSNIQGVVEGAKQMARVLKEAKDESGKLSPELLAAAIAATKTAVEALKLQGNIDAAERVTQELAGIDLGRPFRDANAAAATLAGTVASLNLSNIGRAAELAALQGGSSRSAAEVAGKIAEKRAELADALTAGDPGATELLAQFEAGLNAEAAYSDQIATIIKARADATRSARSSARSEEKAAAKEAEAVRDLIASKRTELAVLRETDPVQKEMLRLREALTAATPQQRAEVERLISATTAEREEMDALKQANDQVKSSFQSGFVSLIRGADDFGDAIGRVAGRLADMAANSLFESIWTAGMGSALSGLGSWFVPGKADGGQVVGQGGPREDNLLHWLSNGEYVVNAGATSRNLPLIEAINAGADRRQILTMILGGSAPALADGGRVGTISAVPPPALYMASGGQGGSGSAGRSMTIAANINVTGAQGDAQIMAMVKAGVTNAIDSAFAHYDREVLPLRVSDVIGDPRRIG